MGTYPPWTEFIDGRAWNKGEPSFNIGPRSAGYYWIFSPPRVPQWAWSRQAESLKVDAFWNSSVDIPRLLIQWTTVVIAALGLLWIFADAGNALPKSVPPIAASQGNVPDAMPSSPGETRSQSRPLLHQSGRGYEKNEHIGRVLASVGAIAGNAVGRIRHAKRRKLAARLGRDYAAKQTLPDKEG